MSILRAMLGIFSHPPTPFPIQRKDPRMARAEKLEKGLCPSCGAKDSMLAGPCGGLCQNIACSQCKTRFNVTPFGIELLDDREHPRPAGE